MPVSLIQVRWQVSFNGRGNTGLVISEILGRKAKEKKKTFVVYMFECFVLIHHFMHHFSIREKEGEGGEEAMSSAHPLRVSMDARAF